MSGLRRGIFLSVMGLASLVLFALGAWQWQRKGQKEAYIAAIEASASAAPKTLAEAMLLDRVRLTGHFLPDKAVPIQFSRPARQPGAARAGNDAAAGFGLLIMTPFVFSEAGARKQSIFVNRGFVPTPPNGVAPPFETPKGEVTITGYLRANETQNWVQPGNDVAKRIFFLRNLPDLALAAGLPEIEQRFFVDQEQAQGETGPPFGLMIHDFIATIPNNHLNYAFTWWALGLVDLLVAGFVVFGARARRGL